MGLLCAYWEKKLLLQLDMMIVPLWISNSFVDTLWSPVVHFGCLKSHVWRFIGRKSTGKMSSYLKSGRDLFKTVDPQYQAWCISSKCCISAEKTGHLEYKPRKYCNLNISSSLPRKQQRHLNTARKLQIWEWVRFRPAVISLPFSSPGSFYRISWFCTMCPFSVLCEWHWEWVMSQLKTLCDVACCQCNTGTSAGQSRCPCTTCRKFTPVAIKYTSISAASQDKGLTEEMPPTSCNNICLLGCTNWLRDLDDEIICVSAYASMEGTDGVSTLW